jgi:hypothetical protein
MVRGNHHHLSFGIHAPSDIDSADIDGSDIDGSTNPLEFQTEQLRMEHWAGVVLLLNSAPQASSKLPLLRVSDGLNAEMAVLHALHQLNATTGSGGGNAAGSGAAEAARAGGGTGGATGAEVGLGPAGAAEGDEETVVVVGCSVSVLLTTATMQVHGHVARFRPPEHVRGLHLDPRPALLVGPTYARFYFSS